jgi:hypothetical protein
MTVHSEHGPCDKIAVMHNPDLSAALHNLAVDYQRATGEKSYSKAVNFVLAQDKTLRDAYAAYSHHDGGMSIGLPVRTSAKPDAKPDSTHHNVSEMVMVLAQDHMAKTGEKSLSVAARAVLAERPELAKRYAQFVGSSK